MKTRGNLCALLLITTFLSPGRAAQKPVDMESGSFRLAVRYAFAETVYSTLELNWWTTLESAHDFSLSQKMRERLGTLVKIDTYIRQEEGDRESVFVAFPGFEVDRFTFVLLFSHINDRYLFGGFVTDFAKEPQDVVYRQQDFLLPENCQTVIKAEFGVQPELLERIQQMAKVALQEAYPGGDGINHVFFRPFSPRFDLHATFYWLEGKKIIRIVLPLNTEPRPVAWKELFDFQQGISSKNPLDLAVFALRMNHEVTTHVADGLMITIDGVRAKRSP